MKKHLAGFLILFGIIIVFGGIGIFYCTASSQGQNREISQALNMQVQESATSDRITALEIGDSDKFVDAADISGKRFSGCTISRTCNPPSTYSYSCSSTGPQSSCIGDLTSGYTCACITGYSSLQTSYTYFGSGCAAWGTLQYTRFFTCIKN